MGVKLLTILVFLGLNLMPPHPELIKKLGETGGLRKISEILKDAYKKGVSKPNAEKLRKLRNLLNESSRPIELPSLVLLVDFLDNQASTPPIHFDSLLFSETLGTYSLRDYYLENSYGRLGISGDVRGWFRMPYHYTYYSNNYGFGQFPQNAQGLVYHAVLAADPYVDFSNYDYDNDGFVDILFVVHAGPGAEETGNPNHIWSHRWVLPYPLYLDGVFVYDYSMEPENGRVGVFVHELAHVFGLPDLYDYDYDSQGLGEFSVMAGGVWGNNGNTPVHFDAWCKSALGFVNPIVIPDQASNIPIPRVEDNPVVYKLWRPNEPNSRQYFLVENRRKVRFDTYLPAEGLLIYHVDELVPNNNNQWYPGHTSYGHYKVALEQADGLWELERNINGGERRDPYPGQLGKRRFDNSTIPSSQDYNFNFTHVKIFNIQPVDDTIYASFNVLPLPDVAINSIISPQGVYLDQSPITPTINVGNYGSTPLNPLINLKIFQNQNLLYNQTLNVPTIYPHDTIRVSFPQFSPPFSNSTYTAVFTNITPQDGYHPNDTMQTPFIVYTVPTQITLHERGQPIIPDGLISPNEWIDAVSVDISNILGIGNTNQIPYPLNTGSLLLKHDGRNLFMGFIHRFPHPIENIGNFRLSVFIDDDASGSFPSGSYSNEGEIYVQGNPQNPSAFFRRITSQGYLDPPQSISLNFGIYTSLDSLTLELAIPLVYPDSLYPWMIQAFPPNHTLKFHTAFRLLNPNLGALSWFPQNLPYEQRLNPQFYTYLTIQDIEILVEEKATLTPNVYTSLTPQGLRLFFDPPLRENTKIIIYTPDGRVLNMVNLNPIKPIKTLDINSLLHLPKGIYFLEISLGKRTFIFKVPVMD